MVLNATFNTNSAISWRSVLLVGVTGVAGEYNEPPASHWQTLSDNVSSKYRLKGAQIHNVSGERH